MDIIIFSHFEVFMFPHVEDVQPSCLHVDLAYASCLIILCCANGGVNKNGYVLDDAPLYHTHTHFAWCLFWEGTNSCLQMSSSEWFWPHTYTTQDPLMRAHQHFDKVTSFYLMPIAKLERWLCFECLFVFIVLLIGFMTSEGTFKCSFHQPQIHALGELSSRTTLFQVGEMIRGELRSSPHHVRHRQHVAQMWIISFMHTYNCVYWMVWYFIFHPLPMTGMRQQVWMQGRMPQMLEDSRSRSWKHERGDGRRAGETAAIGPHAETDRRRLNA
jgi:hypothetical protein